MSLSANAMSRAERLFDLHRRIRDGIPALRRAQFDLGRLLLEVRRINDFTSLGTTTFPMYCESVGLSPTEGRELVGMVEAAAVRPEVEAKVVEARISPQKATVVNEMLKRPELQKPGEDLLSLAQSKSARDLTDELKKRKAEARIGEPPVSRTMHFSAEENRDVLRTQDLVSRMLKRMVSDGEAVGKACRVFLDLYDPLAKAERLEEKDEKAKASLKEKPVPSGALTLEDLKRSRHIAAMTKREILRVVGDRCWVKDCPNRIFVDHCHRRPFRANGSNSLWNLLYLCHEHHGGFDLGRWFPKRRSDGVWVLICLEGKPVGFLRDEVGRFLDAQGIRDGTRGRAPP